MSLPKFLDILQKNALFFSRADLLGDPFEGSMPEKNVIRRDGSISPSLSGVASLSRKSIVNKLMVNCWHANERESAAMWKLYAEDKNIVCIQSTYSTLSNELPSWVHLGAVDYIDYKTDVMKEQGNIFDPISYKRKSFEHEKEIRAVVWEQENFPGLPEHHIRNNANEYGINVPINIENLIHKIYVSPDSPDWFYEVVKNCCGIYKLEKPILHSELSSEPLF